MKSFVQLLRPDLDRIDMVRFISIYPLCYLGEFSKGASFSSMVDRMLNQVTLLTFSCIRFCRKYVMINAGSSIIIIS